MDPRGPAFALEGRYRSKQKGDQAGFQPAPPALRASPPGAKASGLAAIEESRLRSEVSPGCRLKPRLLEIETIVEGGLGARGGPIDLVGQHHVSEDGAGAELEIPRALVEEVEAGCRRSPALRPGCRLGVPTDLAPSFRERC